MRLKPLFFLLILLLSSCKKEIPTNSISNKKNLRRETNSITINKKDSVETKLIQKERFDFETELCSNKGYFDSNKYSREEIKDTYKLWFQSGGIAMSTPSVFKLADLYKVRSEKDLILTKLDADFSKSKKILENLTIVNTLYWQGIKNAYLKELKQNYKKQRIQIESYTNPAVLLNNSFTKNCKNFARALNGSDEELLSTWRKLREEMSKKNGNPEKIMNDFESNSQSSDWKDFAIIDLITFGWGNCANQDIERPLHDEKMNKEFESLFIKTDSECDEP